MTTSYVTQATQWPSAAAIPDDVQKLIALFYETADSKDPGAGLVLAEKVFSKNASLLSAGGAFNGFDEIAKSRDNAWGAVTSRKHEILRVYVHDATGHELVLLGHMQMVCLNGMNLDLPFSARVVVDDDSKAQGRRLKLMQVFADSAPVAEALEK
ncbi:hypothetical protein IQ07DRAFT_65254 [Pyrenochaeta sp. DS3sAY3a]|nr:hypothetical protein IQ07DRAFT_65254 [Pyrenochaeta sp. DS3sAY3a]